ncbi:HGxxPAAW family protein [Actinotalea solisilvae]|uniref:HGxxPAAW family protein n=1 Tax=Actinotalea solisilvae TaxID=2072922 RepID=UPI0018F1B3DE|nr:HGxxPAAW family protein [Actinotalea solisilvae]
MRETHDGSGEVSYLPPAAPPRNHGHTTAAWVTVTLVLVGAVVSSLGVVVAEAWLFWVGLGVVVVALVLGRVLKMLGFGQPGQRAGSHDADKAAA